MAAHARPSGRGKYPPPRRRQQCVRRDALRKTGIRAAEALAARTHRTKTEAVKLALEHELRRLDQALPLRERLRPIQDRILAQPATGLEADKAFYDALQ